VNLDLFYCSEETKLAVRLDARLRAALVRRLPSVAREVVAVVTAEIPAYSTALTGRMRAKIEAAVQVALHGFLELAAQSDAAATPLAPVVDASFDLGRGEARAGRSMDALLSAYRLGARITWRELGSVAVSKGLPADQTALLAELVFAYIDELSAAGAAGHAAELEKLGRARERQLEQLARDLLASASAELLREAAEHAEWTPPTDLMALLVPQNRVDRVVTALGVEVLRTNEAPGLDPGVRCAVLLVPVTSRPALLQQAQNLPVVAGPVRPWTEVASSYARALRALAWGTPDALVDTDEQLGRLVLTADGDALADLSARVLAPLSGLRPAARDKLVQTLRSYLLHQGRREPMAAELFVHPQTVRYRMGQLRELFGDRLEDPHQILDLTLAVGALPTNSRA
jgi:hypothetical protein